MATRVKAEAERLAAQFAERHCLLVSRSVLPDNGHPGMKLVEHGKRETGMAKVCCSDRNMELFGYARRAPSSLFSVYCWNEPLTLVGCEENVILKSVTSSYGLYELIDQIAAWVYETK